MQISIFLNPIPLQQSHNFGLLKVISFTIPKNPSCKDISHVYEMSLPQIFSVVFSENISNCIFIESC